MNGLWNSIAVRFGGFSAHLEALVEPLEDLRTPGIASVYFTQKIDELTRLAARHPAAARHIIVRKAPSAAPLWRDLVLVATGDAAAMEGARTALGEASRIDAAGVAGCCLAVARVKPEQGRELLNHAFAHATVPGQVAILGALLLAESAAPPTLVGELFISMMRGATLAERTQTIYPALARLIASHEGRRSPQVGFLSWLFRGWLSECPEGRPVKEQLEKA